MASAERRLADSGAFVYKNDGAKAEEKFTPFFTPRDSPQFNFGGIEDDHIPFLRLGVDVLHVIASPFPQVWHTLRVRVLFTRYFHLGVHFVFCQDDASALDIPTMRRWNLILRVFMAEYLNLKPSESSRDADEDLKMTRSVEELVSISCHQGSGADIASVVFS